MARIHLLLGCLLFSSLQAHAQDFVTVHSSKDGWSFWHRGTPFFSMGVTTVIPVDTPPADRADAGHYDGLAANGGDVNAWAKHTSERLRSWGFNTLGGWCADPICQQSDLYFTKVLSFGWGGTVGNDRLCDVWSDEYSAAIDDAAKKEVLPLANEPRLIGYFTNNELNWHGAHGWPTDPNDTLLDRYLKLPTNAKGRVHLLQWLQQYFAGDFAKFREAFAAEAKSWDELREVHQMGPERFILAQRVKYAWAGEVAERYFTLSEQAIRKHDPHHLILGCRFAGSAGLAVIEAQARHCDVIAINRYEKSGNPPLDLLDRVFALTGKPILITEYGWRAEQNRSGNKNSHGIDVTVPTQQDRAERLVRFARGCMARPFVLGLHWFQHHDQPTNGRFDGEDANYGIVDQKDQPYQELTDAFTMLSKKIKPGFPRGAVDPAAPKGWEENASLTLQQGPLAAPASLMPAPNEPGRAQTSCDSAHGAKIKLEPVKEGWLCTFDNGTGWGVGPGFFISSVTKYGGARRLHVRVQAPKDLLMRVLLTEDKTRRAADGESFTTETFRGTGTAQDLTFWLEDLQVRPEYGNTNGNRRIDLDGLSGIALAISEPGKSGVVTIMAMELLP